MAKKKKSVEDIIYEIKDLLDELELKVNPEDTYEDDDESDDLITQCGDGGDNDGDKATDFPFDSCCASKRGVTEFGLCVTFLAKR